jgi:hypothetical protein
VTGNTVSARNIIDWLSIFSTTSGIEVTIKPSAEEVVGNQSAKRLTIFGKSGPFAAIRGVGCSGDTSPDEVAYGLVLRGYFTSKNADE